MFKSILSIAILVTFASASFAQETKSPECCPAKNSGNVSLQNATGNFVQFSEITAADGHVEDVKTFARLKLSKAKAHKGLISGIVIVDPSSPRTFKVVEVWHSKARLLDFRKSAAYNEIHGPEALEKMDGWLEDFSTSGMSAAIQVYALGTCPACPSGKNATEVASTKDCPEGVCPVQSADVAGKKISGSTENVADAKTEVNNR